MGKILHLQGLRGLAIISVVLFHFFPKQFINGYLGVDVFFLLSGYLMTMMLSRHDSLNVSAFFDFWYRRVKRITPLYYLVIAILLVVLRFTDFSLQLTNFTSATNAALFATNLVKPTGSEGYFEKLGVAVDIFTHTWSLAVEMQFYLIFPFLFVIFIVLPERVSFVFLYLTSIVSFAFYYTTDDFTSFNSVFSRIWQFNAGMLSFLYVQQVDCLPKEDNEPFIKSQHPYELLKECSEQDAIEVAEEDNRPDLVQHSIVAILILLFFPTQVVSHFARILVTLLTMVILQLGQETTLLNFKALVWIGEVSYSWYLVHWPMAAYAHFGFNDNLIGPIFAMVTSLLIAIIFHYCFERMYVKWEKFATISVVTVLIIVVAGQLVLFKGQINGITSIEKPKLNSSTENIFKGTSDNYPSDFFLENIVYGYENMTKEERIKLNDMHQATDLDRSMRTFCKEFKKTSNPKESRCEMNEGVNKTSPYKLLVVGNSWASNIMSIISSECRNRFNHLEISFMGACEPLVRTDSSVWFNCTYDNMFIDAIKEIKPDVLFIITRHIQMVDIKNGTNAFNDEHFKTASERLSEIQKHVSRRIFILDAFPEITGYSVPFMNSYLSKNIAIDDSKTYAMTTKFLTARMRIARLVQNCPICRVFDYAPQFLINGELKTYDPKYFVSFFTKGLHLTPPAWERVRPLMRHLCNTF